MDYAQDNLRIQFDAKPDITESTHRWIGTTLSPVCPEL